MAYNVFGNPITNSTLEKMPEYVGKTIECKDRASVALNMKNAQERNLTAARQFAEKLKKSSPHTELYTIGMIYNATGQTLTIVIVHNWVGKMAHGIYPVKIENGQTCVFLHNGTVAKSSAAIVYRGKNNDGDECDCMLAWSNTSKKDRVYSEIAEAGYYAEDDVWDDVYLNLNQSGTSNSAEGNGMTSTVKITGNKFEATITQDQDNI